MKQPLGLLLLLVPALLSAQVTVKGVVTEQNSGNKPLPGVQIKALGSIPEQSDNAGHFQLVFNAKKPGDRIIVSEIVKKGYEIVNKDVVNSWHIPSNPEEKTRIVMCPEGQVTQNTLKYYNISLAGLTKAYEARVTSMKQQMEQAQIDRKTYMEQARDLANQYEKQQGQLEELAEKFARENFDDCNAIHQQAFDVFKLGDIAEAIRILESVDSKKEIEKALQEKSKWKDIEKKAIEIQAETDSIIQQNIKKLMFQGDLYAAEFRFGDAERAYEMAVLADTTDFQKVNYYAYFLRRQNKFSEGLKWAQTALHAAKTEYEKARALNDLAFTQFCLNQHELPLIHYAEAIQIIRSLVAEDPERYSIDLANTLLETANMQQELYLYADAEKNITESLSILRNLADSDPKEFEDDLALSLSILARIQQQMNQYENAEKSCSEAIQIYRKVSDKDPKFNKWYLSLSLNELGMIQTRMKEHSRADASFSESLAICREIVMKNPDAYLIEYAITLGNISVVQTQTKQFEKAEETGLEALQIIREVAKSDPQAFMPKLAPALINMAMLYVDLGKYDTAQKYFAESLDLYEQLAGTNPVAYNYMYSVCLFEAGKLLCITKDHDKGQALIDRSLVIMRELEKMNPDSYKHYIAQYLNESAWLLYKYDLDRAINNTFEAISHYLEISLSSGTVYKDIPVDYQLSVCYGRLSRYHLIKKQFTAAEEYAVLDNAYSGDAIRSRLNLAHCLLYSGKYEESREIYLQLKDLEYPLDRSKTIGDLILDDFDEFTEAGLIHPDMERIRKELAN